MAQTALPERAQQVLARVLDGKAPREIADELSVSRNAIYQQIGRLKREGHLPTDGEPTRDEGLLSVEETLRQFEESLRRNLEAIDQRGQELETELDRLREEREKVVQTLDRFLATQG